jgi:hypothetical protein
MLKSLRRQRMLFLMLRQLLQPKLMTSLILRQMFQSLS